MDTIGNRMRALRLNEGMTQNEVAGKSGISENYYSRIETGKNSPSLEKLTAIAKTLGVSLFHLLNDRIEEMEDRVEIEEGRLCDIFKSIPDHQFQPNHVQSDSHYLVAVLDNNCLQTISAYIQ